MSPNISYRHLCSAAPYIATDRNRINSNDGHRLIKELYFKHRKKKNLNRDFNDKVVGKALEIYKSIDAEHRNANVMNAFLKLCLCFNKPHTGLVHVLADVRRYDMISYPWPSLLKCCINSNAFEQGKELHSMIAKHMASRANGDAIDIDIYTQTTLIHFYGHFGDVTNAQNIFESINDDRKTSVTVGAMMKIWTNHGIINKALRLYDVYEWLRDDIVYLLAIKACTKGNHWNKGKQIIDTIDSSDKNKTIAIELSNVMIDDISHILAIKACRQSKYWDKGTQIHSNIIAKKHMIGNTHVSNTLIDLYGCQGNIDNALKLFDGVRRKSKTSSTLNAMMKGLIHNTESKKALLLYKTLHELHDDISHLLAIKACIDCSEYTQGKQIIRLATRHNNNNIALNTRMIEFYGHFGDVKDAQNIFDRIPKKKKDTISIGSMMQVYVENGYEEDVLRMYDEYDALRDSICHMFAIKACINSGQLDRGRAIHASIMKHAADAFHHSVELKNTLIDLYANIGDYAQSLHIFNAIADDDKQIATLNAMMDAYCTSDMNAECLALFESIEKVYRLTPSMISYAVALKACTQCTMWHVGDAIYETLKSNAELHWMLRDISIQINLINLYGKCGMLGTCDEIFDGSDNAAKDIRIWNAIMKAYGRNGDAIKAKQILNEMMCCGELKPDSQMFKTLINAYSHCGDENEAKMLWQTGISDEEVKYDDAVCAALVDCYARKGYIEEAHALIVEYCQYHKYETNNIHTKAMWFALLSGCKQDIAANKEIAQIAYTQINQMEQVTQKC
eukprot:502167_1